MTRFTIAVDAMGGDHGPTVIVPAALQSLAQHSQLHLFLVGDEHTLQQEIAKHTHTDLTRITIHHASQCVDMDESPTQALRYKKDSSMRVAINLVKEGKAQACVSAGNTGALMAIAHFVLKTIPGVDRPAIISALPTKTGRDLRMLDLGANVDSSAMNLAQFAVMGSVLVSTIDNIPRPKVCLLNIGEESIKGNKQVKETAKLLAESPGINYGGFIEGDAIYNGETDIVVCDGFVGNIALKVSEGAARFIRHLIKIEFTQNIFTKLAALIALPILKGVIKHIDPARYNGATFIGLQGIVVKSHGGANVQAFSHAIAEAVVQVEKNILHLIHDGVEKLLKSTSFGTN